MSGSGSGRRKRRDRRSGRGRGSRRGWLGKLGGGFGHRLRNFYRRNGSKVVAFGFGCEVVGPRAGGAAVAAANLKVVKSVGGKMVNRVVLNTGGQLSGKTDARSWRRGR